MAIRLTFLLLTFLPIFLLAQDPFDLARHGEASSMERWLSDYPNSIDTLNADSVSLLILAVYYRNIDVTKVLLLRDCSVNYKCAMGTALHAAAYLGHMPSSSILLEKGADPNISDDQGITPLIYAVQFEHEALIKLLLANNADKSMSDNTGQSPFAYAIQTQNPNIIQLLKTQ